MEDVLLVNKEVLGDGAKELVVAAKAPSSYLVSTAR